MDIMNNVVRLLEEQGKTQKELAEYLGVSTGKFSDWKAGRIASYTKHIAKIAEYLNVSTDYLLGTPSPDKEEAPRPLTEREKINAEILSLYAAMSPKEQEQALSFAKYLVERRKLQEQPDTDA